MIDTCSIGNLSARRHEAREIVERHRCRACSGVVLDGYGVGRLSCQTSSRARRCGSAAITISPSYPARHARRHGRSTACRWISRPGRRWITDAARNRISPRLIGRDSGAAKTLQWVRFWLWWDIVRGYQCRPLASATEESRGLLWSRSRGRAASSVADNPL